MDLVLDRPLLWREKLERHLLVPRVLSQLLVADQLRTQARESISGGLVSGKEGVVSRPLRSREKGCVTHPARLLVNQQHHPLLGALVRKVGRVDGDRIAQRLRGEAELARLRVAVLLELPLLLGALEIRVAASNRREA